MKHRLSLLMVVLALLALSLALTQAQDTNRTADCVENHDPAVGYFPEKVTITIGAGIPVVWTARALEREGFGVHHGGGPAAISVESLQNDAQIAWRLHRDGHIHEFSSLHTLIATLRPPPDTGASRWHSAL